MGLGPGFVHTPANGTSSFQFDRISLCGDVHPQPGPAVKVKYPCKECQRNARSNQNAILCANCQTWSHAKCLGFTNTQFKHYLDNSQIDWICNWCCLPFCNHSDLGFNAESNISNDFETSAIIQDQEGEYANILPTDGQRPHNKACCHENNSSIIDLRKENSSNALLMHPNINSIQNKFEDLTILNRSLKAQILVISETKIDRSYPDSQFKLQGYSMFRKVSSRFVPTDVSFPDDSYPNSDDSYPISVGSYPSLWSIRTLVNNHKKKAF